MRIQLLLLLIFFINTSVFSQTLEVHTEAAHIRAQADKNSAIIGYLKQGAMVISEDWQGNYVRIHTPYSNQAGWVYGPAQNWSQYQTQTSSHLSSTTETVKTAETLNLPYGLSTLPEGISAPRIHDLKLSMNNRDARVLFRKEPNDKSSFALQVNAETNQLPGRVKVKGSFTRNFLKKSLVIQLQDNAYWRGMNKFALNAMPTDPTAMREWLSWDLIKALGIPSPEVDYVRLYINEEFIGLFLQFEWLTNDSFERYGLGSDGDLFHPNDSTFCGDLSLSNSKSLEKCWFNLASNPVNNDEPFMPLRLLVDALNETTADTFDEYAENEIDINSAINWLVTNAIVSNNDTYNKNYFLYRSSVANKWTIVPWDYDLTFGRNADPALPFPGNILNDNFYYLHPPNLGLDNPLKNKILQNKKLLEQFRQRIAHVLGVKHDGSSDASFGWFSPETFLNRIAMLKNTLSFDLQKDLYHPATLEKINKHTEALEWYGLMRYQYLNNLLLKPSVFGTARWVPESVYPLMQDEYPVKTPLSLNSNLNVPTGESWLIPYDEWLSRPMGLLHLPSSTTVSSRIRIEIENEQAPVEYPPGMSSNRCIQRSWFMDVKSPMTEIIMDITLDYLQENSLHNELGQVDQSQSLILWQLSGNNWQPLITYTNNYTNTLSANDVKLIGGQVSRFIACVAP